MQPGPVTLLASPPGAAPVALRVPGGKSATNRALLLAGWARGESVLLNLARCDDSYWCQAALCGLGIAVRWGQDEVSARVLGCIGRAAVPPAAAAELVLQVGASGTLARFLPGLLAARQVGPAVRIEASAQLAARPMQPLRQALAALGGRVDPLGPGGALPWRVRAGGLDGGAVTVDAGPSTQFVSGVVLAALHARGPVRIGADAAALRAPYVRLTCRMARSFGADIDEGAGALTVRPCALRAARLALPADAVCAGYFLALAAAQSRRVTVMGLAAGDDEQGGAVLLRALAAMGCQVERDGGELAVQGPPRLRGRQGFDLAGCGEQLPTIAALAVLADGPIAVRGAARARLHEADRIAAMAEGLRLLGASAEEYPDGLTVTPPAGGPRRATLPTHGDHRVAMAWAVVGSAVGGVTLSEAGCVGKTCPSFFALLAEAGVRCLWPRGEAAPPPR